MNIMNFKVGDTVYYQPEYVTGGTPHQYTIVEFDENFPGAATVTNHSLEPHRKDGWIKLIRGHWHKTRRRAIKISCHQGLNIVGSFQEHRDILAEYNKKRGIKEINKNRFREDSPPSSTIEGFLRIVQWSQITDTLTGKQYFINEIDKTYREWVDGDEKIRRKKYIDPGARKKPSTIQKKYQKYYYSTPAEIEPDNIEEYMAYRRLSY